MITVLRETSTTEISRNAFEGSDELWLSASETMAATTWSIKPEGFCRGDVCVPIPPGKEEHFLRDDLVNVSAFWTLMGKALVRSEDADVWFLGEGAKDRNDALLSLDAPEFSLPDLNGKIHSLSDFRRKRVLLITWASW